MKKAFTLVELLITIVIISVLTALMYISFSGSDESAKRAACIGDRETMKEAFAINRFSDDSDFKNTMENVIKDYSKAHLDSVASDSAVCSGICQDGGKYAITRTPSGGLAILCSKSEHNEILVASATKGIWDKIIETVKGSSGWLSGDGLWSAVLAGNIITAETKYGDYYFGVDVKGGKTGQTILFASTEKHTTAGLAKANYVYNQYTDTWYKCTPALSPASFSEFKFFTEGSDAASVTVKNGDKTYTMTEDKSFRPF